MNSRAVSPCRTAPPFPLRAATCLVLLCLPLLLPPAHARAQPLVVGDHESLWIVQPNVPVGSDAARGVRLIHTRPGRGFPYAAPYPVRLGQIRRCAVLRGELWAFFGGGGPLYIFNPGAGRVGLQLPGGHIPLAFAGVEHGDALLAVVPGRLVDELLKRQRLEEQLLADDNELPATNPTDEHPTTTAQVETQPVEPQPHTGHWLIRCHRGNWEPLEALPDWFDAPADVRLAALDVSLLLAWRPAASPPDDPWRFALRRGEHWSTPEDVPGTPGAAAVEPGWIDQAPALIAFLPVPNDPKRVNLRLLRRRADGWTPFDILDPGGAPFAAPREQLGAAIVHGEVIVALAENAEEIRWARWSEDGGPPLAPLQTVPVISAPPRALERRDSTEWASYVALFLLLAFVMWRRQEALALPAMLPPGIIPAQLGRRFVAFLLDLAPPCILTAPLWWKPFIEFNILQQAYLRDTNLLPSWGMTLWWPLLWVRLAYAAWCLFWEITRGTSPGKLLLRCGILSLSGRRANRAQLIARNLIRIIELEPFLKVWPLMMLVLITRNRQRLGDVWARTIVVQRAPIPPQQTSSGEPNGN